MLKRPLLILTSWFLATLAPTAALAHPHVWVEARAVLNFEAGQLVSIRQHWQFDEFFSFILFEDFDQNKNGSFEPDEVTAMRNGAFLGLGEVNFFTDLRVDGEQVAWRGAREFAVELYDDGSVAYVFTLDLPEPTDMKDASVTLSLYDPDYYVSVDFEPGPSIDYHAMTGQSCTYRLEETEDNAIYFGSVYPVRAVFECTGITG